MILATVGTHEDPFDRLLAELDRLIEAGEIDEPVVVQSGYSTHAARNYPTHKQLPFDELQGLMADARIVITHGGPASIMQAMAHGKIPIVVPRQSGFGEHVDDHQVRFARRMADRVLVVVDIAELGPCIREHAERVAKLEGGVAGPEQAARFAGRLEQLIQGLVGG